MNINKLVSLVETLEENTDLASMLEKCGYSDENDYAIIESWLVEQVGDSLVF